MRNSNLDGERRRVKKSKDKGKQKRRNPRKRKDGRKTNETGSGRK